MDEQENQPIGDGSDDFAEGARKTAEAAKQFGKSGEGEGGDAKNDEPASKNSGNDSGANPADTKGADTGADKPAARNPETGAAPAPALKSGAESSANQATQKGLETGANTAAQKGAELGAATAQKSAEAGINAASNAAATAVQAGTQAGAAVAEVATGTAVAGPWGAVIMAAWSLRHTLFKILICVCLYLVFMIVLVVSLPSLVIDYALGKPASSGVSSTAVMNETFEEISAFVADCVTEGYNYALEKVDILISVGGYDYDISMETLINYGFTTADYDVCYILAAYSVSMAQQGTTIEDLIIKLEIVKDKMFPVTFEEKYRVVIVPPTEPDGKSTIELVKYLECTIHPFDQSVILTAFNINVSAKYSEFDITCGEAIDQMANALKMTMYGALRSGVVPAVTDVELTEFLSELDCSQKRKDLITAAFSLVGRVPYFWGGKSAAGWNDDWNTPKTVTSIGSSTTGTIRPYGLDCTGFTEWVYKTALGENIGTGSYNQYANSTLIIKTELLPGDLGFMAIPGTVATNHVLMYAGKDSSGNLLWVHCEFGVGVHINSPNYVKYYARIKNIDLED